MKLKYTIVLLALFPLSAFADDMTATVWDPGCNHTMATNWFTLGPQEETKRIYVDLSGCTKEQLGSLLFFGNYATKTRGRLLEQRHKVQLSIAALDVHGNIASESASDSGSLLSEISASGSAGCWLVAKNLNRNKAVTIRLRSQLIAP